MFTASRTALLAALSTVRAAVERRNTIPILSNLLLRRADAGRLRVTASNLDVEISVRFTASIEDSFASFTVPADMLLDIVKKLPDGADVRVEAAKSGIVVKSGRSRFALQTLPPEDFPDGFSSAVDSVALSLPGHDLDRVLGACAFAISTEETRYYLNGVCIHHDANGLVFVATDGHKLAKRHLAYPDIPALPASIIIPTQSVKMLRGLAASAGKEPVELDISDLRFVARAGEVELKSKLIAGIFPDYQRVIPRDLPIAVDLDAEALAAAVDRVSTVGGSDSRVKFTLSAEGLKLSATSPEAGQGEDFIDTETDAEMEIGFNGKYVLAAIASIGSERLVLRLSDAGAPAIMQPPDATGDLVVIMPMRV